MNEKIFSLMLEKFINSLVEKHGVEIKINAESAIKKVFDFDAKMNVLYARQEEILTLLKEVENVKAIGENGTGREASGSGGNEETAGSAA